MSNDIKPNSYRQVAAELRDRIASGRLGPGEKLPAERDLSATFKVSRVTVRRALRILEEERLLRRIQGSGAYVSSQPHRRIPLRIDYTGAMEEHAPKLSRQVLTFEWREAGNETANQLSVPLKRKLCYVERCDSLSGKAVAFDRAWIIPEFARKLKRDDCGQVAFIETWTKREKFSVTSCSQTVDAVAAGPELAKLFGLPPKSPLLQSTEIYYAGKVPAGLFISFYNPEYISITARFSWPEVKE